jgi:hypothetical protein
MLKKIFIPLLIVFLIIFIFLIFNLKKPKEIKASPGSGDNVWGWAWAGSPTSTPLEAGSGWISFNCYNDYDNNGVPEDHCPPNYGVHICQSDTDANCVGLAAPKAGKFIGYAWFGGGQDAAGNSTPTLGWLSFNRSETGSPPGPPFNGSEDFIAKVDNVSSTICNIDGNEYLDKACGGDDDPTDPTDTPTTLVANYKQVFGWARVLAATSTPGGWEGWIKFSGGGTQKYGTVIDMNTNPKQFKGWAWGGGGTASSSAVVGWISFNCSNQGVCGTSNYKVLTSLAINNPPSVSNLNQNIEYCRIYPGQAKINLSWTYTDPNNDPQKAFSILVEQFNGTSWEVKVRCENVSQSVSSGGTGSTAVYINRDPPIEASTICESATYIGNLIEYGKNTRWTVKVQDSNDAWSDPETSSFPIDPHSHPYCDFTWLPQRPSVGEIVQFTDQSRCYDSAGNVIPCTGSGPCGTPWCWAFQDGDPSASSIQNPTTTFLSAGSKAVSVRVTDADGYWCEGYQNLLAATINLTLPLPKWKEIKP